MDLEWMVVWIGLISDWNAVLLLYHFNYQVKRVSQISSASNGTIVLTDSADCVSDSDKIKYLNSILLQSCLGCLKSFKSF